ncbi:pantetheine-phosphate adenylyltransferase [Jannaschia sp. R86511]|uniref:pantetheine-phosphate adenylyltransferase n=1 Tax=Jannaschia sp. R86511 TaxID=3093853 RepID=UPI0036D436F7
MSSPHDARDEPPTAAAPPATGEARIAVCPGSYDPVTLGHVDVIARSASLFDQVVAAVVHNPGKAGLFGTDERADLLREVLAADPRTATARVDVVAGGLLVDYCRRIGARAVVKGLRSGTDLAYERPMALMNRHLTGLETVFLPGEPRFEHVSSSLVKEVARNGGDVTDLVPAAVLAPMLQRLRP